MGSHGFPWVPGCFSAQEDLPEMDGELRLEEEEFEETFVSEHFEEDEIGMERIWQVRMANMPTTWLFRNLSTVGVCSISMHISIHIHIRHDQT